MTSEHAFAPEAEVFEITDFTNATEWESFTSRIEDVFREWNLSGTSEEVSAPSSSERQPHDIALGPKVYTLTFFDCRADEATATVQKALIGDGDHFPIRTHCLTRWFGVKTFAVLSPGSGSSDIGDMSQARQLLSSLTIAAGQVGCSVPLFVQLQRAERRMFEGTWHGEGGLRTNFSVVQLRHIPVQYNHLSGVLEIFKTELGVVAPPPVKVAIRFTFMLRSWPVPSVQWSPESMSALPLGANFDPIHTLQLSVTWLNAREDTIVDNALYSDLDPVMAPAWELRPIFEDSINVPGGRFELSSMLSSFLQLCMRKEQLKHLLGRHAFLEDEPSAELQENVRSALQRITNLGMQRSTLSSFVRSAVTSSALEDSPLDDATINNVMHLLFPEVSEDSVRGDSTADKGGDSVCKFRSAPAGSIVERLAPILLWIHEERGGVRAMAHIWREFVLHLRQSYEHNQVLPDIPRNSVPDMRYCLLQQKLHMLQCCIEHKLARARTCSEKVFLSGGETAASHVAEGDSQSSAENSSVVNKQSASWVDAEDMPVGVESDNGETTCMQRLVPAVEDLQNEPEDSSGQAKERDVGDEGIAKRISSLESDSEDEFFEAVEEHLPESSRPSSLSGETESASEANRGNESSNTLQEEDASASKKDPSAPNDVHSGNMATSADMDTGSAHGDGTDEMDGSKPSKPVGVLSTTGMVLLASGQPLNIPITQQVTPMTEDMIAEQQQILASLGTSDEARQLRARMQSTQVLADMEAFKAANPGCVLGDFVRWYSPRDWVEDEGKDPPHEEAAPETLVEDSANVGLEQQQGAESWSEAEWDVVTENEMLASAMDGMGMTNHDLVRQSSPVQGESPPSTGYFCSGRLSIRMRDANSLWHQLWASARAVPAHRQRRLFDDTAEATKVLGFLQDLSIGELALHIAPVVLHRALLQVQQQPECALPSIKLLLEMAECELSSLFQTTPDCLPALKRIVGLLAQIEAKLVQARALREIFKWGYEHCCLSKSKDALTERGLDEVLEEALTQPHISFPKASHGSLGRAVCGIATMQVFHLEQQSTQKQTAAGTEQEPSKKARPAITKFPLPAAREFLLRTSLPRPSPASRPSSHRMFAILTAGEFRLASAFSSDMAFF